MTRVMKHIADGILAGMLLMLSVSCEFRPLSETGNMSYVRIYIDEHLLNITTGFYNEKFHHPAYHKPDIMRVALFEPGTGRMVGERYLRGQGDDERGHYYYGYILAEAGRYDLLAYNFGTESTVVGNEYDFHTMLAYTNTIAPMLRSRLASRDPGSSQESIRYDADHLFVARAEGLAVGFHEGIDTLRNTNGEPWFLARSVVKSYYLQVGVTGAQYLSAASVLLTGMGRQVRLSDSNFTDGGEATLYFDMLNGSYSKEGADFECIYGTFGTFGRLPDAENDLTVSFELVTTYGKQFEKTIPIKEVFLREDALLRQWLIIDEVIEIPPPPLPPEEKEGGLNPAVGDWNDVGSTINI